MTSTEVKAPLVYVVETESPVKPPKDVLDDSLSVSQECESKDSVDGQVEELHDSSFAKVDDDSIDTSNVQKDDTLSAEPNDSASVKVSCSFFDEGDEPLVPFDTSSCAEIRTVKNDFVRLENVLPCVKKNEKVAFIVRHGERDYYQSGPDDHLNENGVKGACKLGKRLSVYDDFYYMHSYYIRTMETAYYVAEGKGQKVEPFTRENSDSLVHEITDDLLYSWYVKDYAYEYVCSPNGGLVSLTKMAYETEDYYCNMGFYNAEERTLEFVKKYFTYNRMHGVTFAVTHDYFVAPLVIAITDGEIGMDYYNHVGDEYYWPNFLSGAAVIVDDKDSVTMVPVKGLSSGRLGGH